MGDRLVVIALPSLRIVWMAYDAPFLAKYKASNLRQPRLLQPITIQ
jgi:hypothetical protein